jgi:hypothetical protein
MQPNTHQLSQFANILMCSVLTLVGCNRSPTSAPIRIDELAAEFASVKNETEAQVQGVVSHATACERAVMFIHVDWAFMEPQRTRFIEFVHEYQKVHPHEAVLFHYVDCTPIDSGYGPLKNIPGWSELQEEAGTSLIHGWGEVAWLANGRVLHVESILNFESVAELVAKTESLMP